MQNCSAMVCGMPCMCGVCTLNLLYFYVLCKLKRPWVFGMNCAPMLWRVMGFEFQINLTTRERDFDKFFVNMFAMIICGALWFALYRGCKSKKLSRKTKKDDYKKYSTFRTLNNEITKKNIILFKLSHFPSN